MNYGRNALAALAYLVALAAPPCGAAGAGAYHPRLTAWGDPDFRATWTMERVAEAGIPLERPPETGNRAWLNDEEFAKRLDAAKKSDAGFREDVDANGTPASRRGFGQRRSPAAAR